MKPKHIIIFICSFLLLILYIEISHRYALKRDLPVKVNFLVAVIKDRANAYCDVFDEDKNEFPLKSYSFVRHQIYTGDSIVKESNSNIIYIYRKRNWRDYKSDDSYYIAKKIQYDKW